MNRDVDIKKSVEENTVISDTIDLNDIESQIQINEICTVKKKKLAGLDGDGPKRPRRQCSSMFSRDAVLARHKSDEEVETETVSFCLHLSHPGIFHIFTGRGC